MQLCPNTATSWWGNLRLPSRACKFSSSLADKAYTACGEAASTLHALLQVYQAKALKGLHEDSTDPGIMQELHAAMDLALWATKVTARSLGVWFLNTPVCQACHFADTIENFAQQFSVVQKQTEAIKYILPP